MTPTTGGPAFPWRPIETLPRDHTYVLLLSPSGVVTTPYRIEVGYYDAEYRPLDPIRCLGNESWMDQGPSQPTHWMPLDTIEALRTEAARLTAQLDAAEQHVKILRGDPPATHGECYDCGATNVVIVTERENDTGSHEERAYCATCATARRSATGRTA